METLNLEILNPGPILADLKTKLRALAESPHFYLRRQANVRHDAEPHINELGIRESSLPAILQMIGIRSVTLNAPQDLMPLHRLIDDIPPAAADHEQWRYLTCDAVMQVLQPFLANCRTIAFQDWAGLSGASELWSSLLRGVIRPGGRQALEFIFYLGDPLSRRSFQVEEVLDIIGEFSQHGQVTVALDEEEAIKLWMVLNGVHEYSSVTGQVFPDLKRKYISIFRTILVDRLLVYSATQAMIFTRQAQLLLARKKVASSFEIAPEARESFIDGFCIGLVRQLDIVRCLALGLIVFGSRSETGEKQPGLVSYIDRWQEDLQQQEIMYLYQ
ncbi:hypothetical protein [Dyadobacter fermentans]|uniref:Uncharacterized protein n=1 Tax=Dyadobacter fermentans (strain ATCC 700827 / DSM 18053 / CIP 107007 / KCTC 52180 / NS114) TaxID=471854 RepID=C6VUF3_DYAFD|nr:hypothetical protein [Dyadobacter fermentans]ACT96635.1 hypothetical protein Dfer_5443 [Dyadobacter fermentans DSM 18053]